MLEFQEINAATYTSLRRSILKKMEEPREEVYFDLTIKDKQGNIISEDGDPTIGIGIDIRKEEGREFAIGWMFGKYANVGIKPDSDFRQDIRSAVAENSSYQTAASLQARLNQIMAARSGDSSAKFAFDNAAEMDRAFDQMADTIYEKKINEWIRKDSNLPSDYVIKNSYERLALFSIVFNGGKGTLGSDLKQALWNNDRPESWYQIRYRTNKNRLPGLAKRRYFESQLFALYEDRLTTGVTAEESAAVISMYNKHGSTIKLTMPNIVVR